MYYVHVKIYVILGGICHKCETLLHIFIGEHWIIIIVKHRRKTLLQYLGIQRIHFKCFKQTIARLWQTSQNSVWWCCHLRAHRLLWLEFWQIQPNSQLLLLEFHSIHRIVSYRMVFYRIVLYRMYVCMYVRGSGLTLWFEGLFLPFVSCQGKSIT